MLASNKRRIKLIRSVWHVVVYKSNGVSAEPALVVDVINVPRNFNSRIKLKETEKDDISLAQQATSGPSCPVLKVFRSNTEGQTCPVGLLATNDQLVA
jgi:hypothetical protein